MMTGSGIQTPERDAFAWFIPCLGLKNYVVTSAADAHTRPGDFRSNPELLFGVVRAFRHGPAADAYIDDLRSDGRVTEVADSEFLYKMLLAGRFHAFMALLPSIEFYIDQYKLQDKLAVSDWFPDDPPIVHYLVFSKKAFSEADMSEWRPRCRNDCRRNPRTHLCNISGRAKRPGHDRYPPLSPAVFPTASAP